MLIMIPAITYNTTGKLSNKNEYELGYSFIFSGNIECITSFQLHFDDVCYWEYKMLKFYFKRPIVDGVYT